MQTKTCPRCKEVKNQSLFSKDKVQRDGLSTYCKTCRSLRRRVKYDSRECKCCGKSFVPKMSDSSTCSAKCSAQLSRDNNKERIRRSNQDYYARNKESEIARAKKYYQENKEKLQVQRKDYHKKWRDANKDKIKSYYDAEWRREYETEKRKDMNYRLASNLRKRLSKLVRGGKSESTLELLGCSLDEFRAHLEELFEDGMTWENYGKWHIDHILPCDAFELQNSEEREVCFHFVNLQPLWADDNITKSNNLI